jgi:aerobic-type carbon monoxide dehydrogenase small subunit (CoxS/CutS family)
MRLELTLNGSPVDLDEDPTATLLDWLRSLGLTGTKEGCGIGVCGACTVLGDGRPISACLTLIGTLDGLSVLTVEGVAQSEPTLIEAFVDCEAMQCGICTPGHVMAAAAAKLAGIGASADVDSEIRYWLEGNLCRCTGYETIVAALRSYLER